MSDLLLTRFGTEAAARDVVERFYAGSRAYRRLIDATLHHLGKSELRELSWNELPILTKDSFYTANPWSEYVPRESLRDIYSIIRSSGTTSPEGAGRGFFWPQLRSHDIALTPLLQARLIEAFQLQTRKTLVIVGLSLGSWAGGEQFSFTFKALALQKRFPLVVFSPGNQHAEILELIGAIGDEVDQILIALCPSAIFYLEKLAEHRGQNLPLAKIAFLVTGEPFPEELRLDLAHRAGRDGGAPIMLSVYGSADTGLIGAESAPLIHVRQYLCAHPQVARQLGFTSASIPNLYHVAGDGSFYEVVNGELVITRWQGIPLARYNLKDFVQLYSWPVLCRALASADHDNARFWIDMAEQPLTDIMSVAGRAHGCLFLCGSNVFETMLEKVFSKSGLRALSTGVFCAWTELDRGRQVLYWQVELSEGQDEPSESEVRSLHAQIVELLGQEQPEFADDHERFYRPFEQDGLRIFRFIFTPAPRLSALLQPRDQAQDHHRARAAGMTRTSLTTAFSLGAVWGVCEGTWFFLVPDILLSYFAIDSLRRAMAAALGVVLGAMAAACVLYSMLGVDRVDADFLIPQIWSALPGFRFPMLAAAARYLEADGARGLISGPSSGIPYRVFVVAANRLGISLPQILLWTPLARLERILLAPLVVVIAHCSFAKPPEG